MTDDLFSGIPAPVRPLTAEELVAAKLKARKDPKEHVANAPPGYRLKGVSTLVDATGALVQQWVKTTSEIDPLALLQQFRAAIAEEPLARYTPAPPPVDLDPDRLAMYCFGDPHFGMLSWPAETGERFDIQIARAHLSAAVDRLVALAPPTEIGVLFNAGDFLHADNFEGVTARSGHALDTDSRWPKVLRVSVWTLVHVIRRMLEKHRIVRVYNEKGNHDDQSAIMLALCLAMHFDTEPRVIVEESPAMFHYLEFGRNLFGFTHGHTVKAQNLPGVMAADQPEAWGRTKFRYWLTGHVHHESKKEYAGCIVETFRTLAAKDAWHHGQGYRAGRSLVCDVYHRDYGRIIRNEIGVEQLILETGVGAP